MDYRLNVERFESLKVLTFAEGQDKAKGVDRYHLHQADEFAVYTAPPSPAELLAVLDIVKPKKIYVFGVSPKFENSALTKVTDEFLTQLAGMTKYAINNRGGKVSIQELASATAQRESVIRIGLEWLAAGGHVAMSSEKEALTLSAGTGETNQYLQKELYVAIRGILQERAAYHEYFSHASLDSIMGLLSA
jgi:hypothetical protein